MVALSWDAVWPDGFLLGDQAPSAECQGDSNKFVIVYVERHVEFDVYKSAGAAVSRQAVVLHLWPSWSQVCTVLTSPVQQ